MLCSRYLVSRKFTTLQALEKREAEAWEICFWQVCIHVIPTVLLYYYDRSFSHMSWRVVNRTILALVICHFVPWTSSKYTENRLKMKNFPNFGYIWFIQVELMNRESKPPQKLVIWLSMTWKWNENFKFTLLCEQFFPWSSVTWRFEHLSQWTIGVICHTPWTIGRNSTVVPYRTPLVSVNCGFFHSHTTLRSTGRSYRKYI